MTLSPKSVLIIFIFLSTEKSLFKNIFADALEKATAVTSSIQVSCSLQLWTLYLKFSRLIVIVNSIASIEVKRLMKF